MGAVAFQRALSRCRCVELCLGWDQLEVVGESMVFRLGNHLMRVEEKGSNHHRRTAHSNSQPVHPHSLFEKMSAAIQE